MADQHVLAWPASEGMRRVMLLADEDNAAALASYEQLGFEESATVVRQERLGVQFTGSVR